MTGGQSALATVTLTNSADSPMTIMTSKPPTDPALTVLDALDEGTTIAPGASRTLRVRFAPTATGPIADVWTINGAGRGCG